MKTVLLAFVSSVFLLECQGTVISDYKPIGEVNNGTGFRLPGTAFPNSYNLTLQIDLSYVVPKANGQVTINLNVSKDNDQNLLYLNSKVNFDADANATWTDLNKNTTQNCSISNDPTTDYIILNCTNAINGTTYQSVTIPFTPTIETESLKGAYVARYEGEDGNRKYILATQFEQDLARTVFPCFDEPQYKAPITLTLITPKNSTYNETERIANTRLQNVSTIDELTITTFEPTPNMSTYLLAFMLTEEFVTYPNTSSNNNYTFQVFARNSAENQLNTALTYGPKLVDKMGIFTKIPYPDLGNKDLTLAAVPEFAAGAMENWGLITFRETYLIDEGEKTSPKDVQAIVMVIAHEITHQWFGDYVTLDWWSDTWLNEGFAQYFSYYLTEQVFQESVENTELWEQFVIKEQQPALKVDAYPDSIPLSNNASNVITKSDITKEFGTISYSKGASIIKLLNHTIGENDFKQGLRKYLKTHNYQTATSADLIHSLEQKTTVNVSQYFNEWIYKAGYPILEVSLNTTDAQSVNIYPKRFSSSLNKTGEDNSSIWWIPLTYVTPVDLSKNITWLSPGENYTINNFTSDWILVNVDALGFYRVNYDETLWNRLIDALKSESFGNISVINRAQLLDDVFNIARFYDGDEEQKIEYYSRAFKLADYLVNETEYHPWYTFFVEIQYLLDAIQDEDTLNALRKKVLDLVSKQADVALKATASESQTHIEVLKNELLLSWACKLGHEDCVNWALSNIESYLDFTSKNNSDYRDVVLCTALANSADEDLFSNFTIILLRMDESITPLKENSLAKSLGCIKNTTYVSLMLQATLEDDEPLKNHKFSRMVYPTIFSSLISNGKENLIETINYIEKKDISINLIWEPVLSPESIWTSIGSKCYSNDCKTIIAKYVENNKYDTSREDMVKPANQSLDTIDMNLKWVDMYEETLKSVFVIPTTESPPETSTAGVAKVGFSIILGCSIILLVYLI